MDLFFWGRVNEEFLKDIRPFFEKSFIFLNSKLKKIRDRFCEHLAYMGVYGSENPIQQGWLLDFLKKVELKDLVSWAKYVGQSLSGLSNEAKQNLWQKWIEDYWKMRVSGVPLQFHPDEIREMIEWTLELEPVFERAVDLLYDSPVPKIEHTNIFHNLLEGNFLSQYPKASAKLLLYVLPSIKYPWYNRDISSIFSVLEKMDIDHLLLNKIKDEMTRLGC